jgi:hypothetical protein
MLNEKEVKELGENVNQYYIDLLEIFNEKKEEELLIRDYINDPNYRDNKKINRFNKNEIQYYFDVGSLYFKLFVLKDSIKITYTTLDDFNSYYPHNNTKHEIFKASIIGLNLLKEKMKRYYPFITFKMDISIEEYQRLSRDYDLKTLLKANH